MSNSKANCGNSYKWFLLKDGAVVALSATRSGCSYEAIERGLAVTENGWNKLSDGVQIVDSRTLAELTAKAASAQAPFRDLMPKGLQSSPAPSSLRAGSVRYIDDHAISTNPKRAFGIQKPCAQFIPPVAIIAEAAVMGVGAEKYGAFNWNDKPVDATTYYSAAMRHMMAWFAGEDNDDTPGGSGLPHLAHVRACCGILLDAAAMGNLIDDRPRCASASAAIARLETTAAKPN